MAPCLSLRLLSRAHAGRLWAALLAATLLNLPLGSVYSFSVLLRPLEQELGIPRSALSLVFGVATAGFTVGSVAAAFLYRVASAPILVFASALVAAGGVAVAATAHGLPQLLLGYGVVFGTGGGVAYILLQQGVNMLVTRRRGLVNGYIVSLYPMGAMIATPAFHACNEAFGWRTTLGGLAAVLLACGTAAALLAWHSGARLAVPAGGPGAGSGRRRWASTFFKLSATFFLAASAGLMVLSQAREIDRHLWRRDGAGGGRHDRSHRGDRGGAHRRRLAGRPLRRAARDVRGARAGAGRRAAADALSRAGHGGAGAGDDRRRLRLRLRLDGRRDRPLLAGRRLRPRRRPHLHRLVPGRHLPAGAGRLPVRHHAQLRHGDADRCRRQPAGMAMALTMPRRGRNGG